MFVSGKRICFCCAALVCSASAGSVRADIYYLTPGGQVRGTEVKGSEAKDQIVIETSTGGRVVLDKALIDRVDAQKSIELEYEKMRAQATETVESQWELAEWCRKNDLTRQRKTHLEKVIALDPGHASARGALGYFQVGGKWTTQKQLMSERGYIFHKGHWRLPQELETFDRRHRDEMAAKEWYQKIKRWREWLKGNRAPEAMAGIAAINDPFAVPGLMEHLKKETNPQARLVFLEPLARINSPVSRMFLVEISLQDPVEEVRLTAIDYLAKHKSPDVVKKYTQALKHKDNVTVNNAAIGLKAMSEPSSIEPLIGALITAHRRKVQSGSNQTAAGFGTGGTSMGFGAKTLFVTDYIRNNAVLDSLIAMTGKNFDFDVQAWKIWYASQKKPEVINLRRDDPPPKGKK